jgi:dihydroxy-acid dehydratase
VKDGDRIVIDAATRRIDWFVDEETQKKRREEWLASDRGKLNVKRGVLLRYARDVAVSPPLLQFSLKLVSKQTLQPASLGAYCD